MDTTVYTLVTTAHEETWPKDKPILFLGDWCVPYNRRHLLHNLDYVIHPYHWDDMQKKYQDSIYLDKIYNAVFPEISNKLNKIHRVLYSDKYWEILIGKWLSNFIYITFDRWTSLSQVFAKYSINNIYHLNRDFNSIILDDPLIDNGMDDWNEAFFLEIISVFFLKDKKINMHKLQGRQKENLKAVRKISKPNFVIFKEAAKKAFDNIGSKLMPRKVIFYKTGISLNSQLKIQFKLGQWPLISPPDFGNTRLNVATKKEVSRDWGQWITNKNNDDFINVLSVMAAKCFPTNFLESYDYFSKNCQPINFPKSPKIIFSGGGVSIWNVLDSFWMAEKVEQGSILVILQHGGGYGISKQIWYEEYEKRISDYFFSWGWKSGKGSGVVPVGILKTLGIKIKMNSCRKAVLTTVNFHRYLKTPEYAIDTSLDEYFQDQIDFYNNLRGSLRKNMLVKTYPGCYKGRFQRQRWLDNCPDVVFVKKEYKITSFFKKGCLQICTYNGTTLLESLSLNIPTIIFLRGDTVRQSASPHFDKLKSARILFDNPYDAAKHINEIWDDIPAWWESDKVYSARREFCNQYCYSDNKSLDVVADFLRNI